MIDTHPTHFNFAHDVVERWAQQRPEAIALWWTDEHAKERRISFEQMGQELRRAANFFESLGIRRGDRVLVVLPRVPQFWVTMLGLIRLGAVPIPGTPLLTAKDLHYRLQVAEIRAVVTDEDGAGKIGDFNGVRVLVGDWPRAGWHGFDHGVAQASDQRKYEPTRAQDPGIIYFTSGTAGEAKMVLHTQASYGIGHTITGKYWLDLHPGDICWTLADTGWGKTAWSSFFGPWSQGATVFTLDMRSKFEPGLVLKTLQHYPITVFCSPATALRLIVRKDLSAYQFPHLRHCVSAGEALNPPVARAWKAATGLTVYEGYGQTETVCVIGHYRALGHEVRPGSMGRAAPGLDVSVVDAAGQELPPGQTGQIAIRVKPVRPLPLFVEYWKSPQETAARYVGDWYLTGDTAYRDADGYFYFVGRADDVINSSSYRIGPSEVESALLEHAAVLEAGVIGVPEELRGEVVRAYVVLRPGYQPDDHLKRELQAHCKRVTAPYKYPRQIEFVAELPKTASGKVRRIELRQLASAEAHSAGPKTRPADAAPDPR